MIIFSLKTISLRLLSFFNCLKYNFKYLMLNLSISIVFCVLSSVIGLIVNLYFPKMEYTHPIFLFAYSCSFLRFFYIHFSLFQENYSINLSKIFIYIFCIQHYRVCFYFIILCSKFLYKAAIIIYFYILSIFCFIKIKLF